MNIILYHPEAYAHRYFETLFSAPTEIAARKAAWDALRTEINRRMPTWKQQLKDRYAENYRYRKLGREPISQGDGTYSYKNYRLRLTSVRVLGKLEV